MCNLFCLFLKMFLEAPGDCSILERSGTFFLISLNRGEITISRCLGSMIRVTSRVPGTEPIVVCTPFDVWHIVPRVYFVRVSLSTNKNAVRYTKYSVHVRPLYVDLNTLPCRTIGRLSLVRVVVLRSVRFV